MSSTTECFWWLFVCFSFSLTTKYILLRYHKIQKKARRKEFLKQFEEMVKTNPQAALEELKKLEMSRMQVCGEKWKEIMNKWELFGLKYIFLTCFHYRRGCLSNIRTKASGPKLRLSWQNMMIRWVYLFFYTRIRTRICYSWFPSLDISFITVTQ